jgi:N-methylhydantoinase B
MLTTSRSPIFSQFLDFVTGIFDARGRWVATKDYIPVLAGSLPSAYEGIVHRFADEVHDGDIYILNDPYHGNNHPPDVTVAKPVFFEGQLRFWAISKGHHSDVGGSGVVGYNPYAKDCWEDALRIPPVRLYDRGVYQRDVWDLILLNVRMREFVEGDLQCQIGAVKVGEHALVAMLEKFGVERVEAALDYHLAASERHMAEEISRLPDGVYRSRRRLDNGGAHHRQQITVKLELRIEGQEITFDFTGSDPQVPGFVNSTYANTVASCLIGLFSVVDPDIPVNGGSIAPVRIVTEPGTIVHAVEPAATTLNTVTTCEAIIETIWLAIAQAAPTATNAGWTRGWSLGAAGYNERTERPFAGFVGFGGGGAGATYGFDGWDGLGTPITMGGNKTMDAELHELASPFTVLGFGLDTDSAGPGTWRGGNGSWLRWRCEQDELPLVSYGSGSLEETAPFGIEGGHASTPNTVVLHRADGSTEAAVLNSIATIQRGDIVEAHFSGGGGYGDPRQREAVAVLDDVRNEVLTAEVAEKVYGVVVDPSSWSVDAAATADRRLQ